MLSFTSSGGGFLGRGPVLPRASLKNPAGGGGDKDGAAATAGGKRGGGVGRAKCGYRFYVLKQGYLRNSRRIMEISPGAPDILLIDLTGIERSRVVVSDVLNVKLASDENTFILQNRKGSETYVCSKRSELLCVLLPMIQGDLGGQIFQLSKISKRQIQTQDAAAQDGISTEPRSYRVWSGKIAYADHDARALSDQQVILPQGGSSNLGMSEVWLDALTKVVMPSEDTHDAVLIMRSRRPIWLRCSGTQQDGRERLAKAVADTAVSQLGMHVPLESCSHAEALEASNRAFQALPQGGDATWKVCVGRVGRGGAGEDGAGKQRVLEAHGGILLERGCQVDDVVHHCIPLDEVHALVRCKATDGQLCLICSSGKAHVYLFGERDALLCDILDAGGAGNSLQPPILLEDCHAGRKVRGLPTDGGEREYEDALVERLAGENTSSGSMNLVEEFLTNMAPHGAARCGGKRIISTLLERLALISGKSTSAADATAAPSTSATPGGTVAGVNVRSATPPRREQPAGADSAPSTPSRNRQQAEAANTPMTGHKTGQKTASDQSNPHATPSVKSSLPAGRPPLPPPPVPGSAECVSAVTLAAAVQKVLVSKAAFDEVSTLRKEAGWLSIIAMIGWQDPVASHAALSVLRSAVRHAWIRSAPGASRCEPINRNLLLDDAALKSVGGTLERASRSESLLPVFGVLELLEAVLHSSAENTDLDTFERVVKHIRPHAAILASLCRSRSLGVARRATRVLVVMLSSETCPDRASLQDDIRSSCELLWHLLAVLESPSSAQRAVSMDLVELLVDENAASFELLGRILPASLMSCLYVKQKLSASAELRARNAGGRERKAVHNWPLLFDKMLADAEGCEIVWNHECRRELAESLRSEMAEFEAAKKRYGEGQVTWNYGEYSVTYQSLKDLVKVGRYYVSFILRDDFDVASFQGAFKFLGQLYHTFLTEPARGVKETCLEVMTKLYKHFNSQPFDSHTLHCLVEALDSDAPQEGAGPSTTMTLNDSMPDRSYATHATVPVDGGGVRRRLFDLLEATLGNAANGRNLLQSTRCLAVLTRLLTLVHVPLITAGIAAPICGATLGMPSSPGEPGIVGASFCETDPEGEEVALRSLRLMKLLVSLMPSVTPSGALIRPVPLAKRVLCGSPSINYIVQLLLRGKRDINAAVVALLESVFQHNEHQALQMMLPSGIVYFLVSSLGAEEDIPEATEGSKVPPGAHLRAVSVGRLLSAMMQADAFRAREREKSTAAKQGGGDDGQGADEVRCRGVPTARQQMSTVLPQSLILQLEKRGPAAFGSKFFGTYADATVVWDGDMRSRLFSALALHMLPLAEGLAHDSLTIWDFQVCPQVVYPEVAQNFWVGNEKLGYFLRHIASGDGDAKVLAEDASPLLEMLMKKLDDAQVGGEESLLLLQVISKLYRRFGSASQHQFHSLGPGFAILGRIARESVQLAATSGVKGGGGGVTSMRRCAAALRLAMECSPDNVSMAVRHLVPEVVSCGLRLAVPALLELECIASKGGADGSPVRQIGILGGTWGGDGVIKGGQAGGVPELRSLAVDCLVCCSIVARHGQGDAIERIATSPASVAKESHLGASPIVGGLGLSADDFGEWGSESGEEELVSIITVCLQCDDQEVAVSATVCSGELSRHTALRNRLVSRGAHILLLRHLLREVQHMSDGKASAAATSAAAAAAAPAPAAAAAGGCRERAVKIARALWQLLGDFGEGSEEAEVMAAKLLTPPLYERLRMADEFVELFAGETFTPELVWGDVNRSELGEVIKTLFAGINVTSPKIARGEGGSWPVSPPPMQSISGKIGKVAYSNIRDLTRVGGIYLEVLNQRPDWPLGSPSLLLGKVLDMLEHGVDGSPPSNQQCFAGLEVARSICRADPAVCTAQRTKVLLTLLVGEVGHEGEREWTEVAPLILSVLSHALRKSAAVRSFAESGGLRVALGVLRGALGGRWPPGAESACVGGMLEAITSIAESAEYACLVRGGVVEPLVALLCGGPPGQTIRIAPEWRSLAAGTISPLCRPPPPGGADARTALEKYLPRGILDLMWSAPGQGVRIIDGQYDTPYIRWDVACKQDVQVALGKGFPPKGSVEQQDKLAYLLEQQSEMVGGVFVRVLNRAPAVKGDQEGGVEDPKALFTACSAAVQKACTDADAGTDWTLSDSVVGECIVACGWLASGYASIIFGEGASQGGGDAERRALLSSLLSILRCARSQLPDSATTLRRTIMTSAVIASANWRGGGSGGGVSDKGVCIGTVENVDSLVTVLEADAKACRGSGRACDGEHFSQPLAIIDILQAGIREWPGLISLLSNHATCPEVLRGLILGDDDQIQVAGAGLLWIMGSDANYGYSVRQAIPEVHVWELVRTKASSSGGAGEAREKEDVMGTASPDSKGGDAPPTM